MKNRIYTFIFLITSLTVFSQPLELRIEGVSDAEKNTIMQDREEALVDAKLKIFQLMGVDLSMVESMSSFALKQKWVELKAETVLLPGYQVKNLGYGGDGRFRVELVAQVVKITHEALQGDVAYMKAMGLYESDKAEALKIFREIVDKHKYSDSADDALYHLIINSDYWSGISRLGKMKSDYPDSPYLADAEYYVKNIKVPGPLSEMYFIPLPIGEFKMGSPKEEKKREKDEGPQRRVLIRPLYMTETEVTQRQWIEVMGENPSRFEGADNPVERISWNDVQDFLERLNAMDPGKKYRLPTEAEWEYACRAGSEFRFCAGEEESYLDSLAWYKANSDGAAHPAGSRQANAFRLKDMHGNVAEWVQDPYSDNYLGAPTDGGVWLKGDRDKRVVRGGSWSDSADECRCADRKWHYRDSKYSNVGFRIVREL